MSDLRSRIMRKLSSTPSSTPQKRQDVLGHKELAQLFSPVEEFNPLRALEKQKSLRTFAEVIEARKKFYQSEYTLLNVEFKAENDYTGNQHNYNYQAYMLDQKEYEKNYKKLKNLENTIDKQRNIMMQWVSTYEHLLQVALREIEEYDLNAITSFPVFSFGRWKGDPLINCEVAQKFMRHLTDSNRNSNMRIFNQIPYLDMNLWDKVNIKRDLKEKFEKFYIPLLESGKIKKMCMMQWWEHAPWCVTEHNTAKQEWLEISYHEAFPGMWVKYW